MTNAQQITLQLPRRLPNGEIVALDVSEADFMAHYAATFHEWVNGVVIKMSPARLSHNHIARFIQELLRAYFALRPIGQVEAAPFVMRLPTSRREPDVMVILGENRAHLGETYMDGSADIVVEVVSPGSMDVDYGDKFREYAAGGVPEYWLIDPIRKVTLFHRLQQNSYTVAELDDPQRYSTPLLPDFYLPVTTLWQLQLPDVIECVALVRAMLAD